MGRNPFQSALIGGLMLMLLSRVGLAQEVGPEITPLPRTLPGTAQDQNGAPPRATLGAPVPSQATTSLDDLIRLSLDSNPTLKQTALEIKVKEGKRLQVGLYPNPVLIGVFDELGDRTSTGGVNNYPVINQEVVVAGKLKLNRSVAQKEVDQATLALLYQRYQLLANVRKGYFTVLTLQRRVEVLEELKGLADRAYENAERLYKGQQIAKLEVLQFSIVRNRLAATLAAAQQEWRASWQQLTAIMGTPGLPQVKLSGSLEAALPEYNFALARDAVARYHPQVRSAEIGVTKAQIALRRADVEKYPNIILGTGYTRQNQNKSDDFRFEFAMPIPVFDRNQGNVLSAKAQLSQAVAEVGKTQNQLINELANAFGRYASARNRSEYYRKGILEDAKESFRLSVLAFRGGQFEYLRVLQAQQFIVEAELEYLQYLSEAWVAASEISGLLLQECWPPTPLTAQTSEGKQGQSDGETGQGGQGRQSGAGGGPAVLPGLGALPGGGLPQFDPGLGQPGGGLPSGGAAPGPNQPQLTPGQMQRPSGGLGGSGGSSS